MIEKEILEILQRNLKICLRNNRDSNGVTVSVVLFYEEKQENLIEHVKICEDETYISLD